MASAVLMDALELLVTRELKRAAALGRAKIRFLTHCSGTAEAMP
jgi:hypothetical protein